MKTGSGFRPLTPEERSEREARALAAAAQSETDRQRAAERAFYVSEMAKESHYEREVAARARALRPLTAEQREMMRLSEEKWKRMKTEQAEQRRVEEGRGLAERIGGRVLPRAPVCPKCGHAGSREFGIHPETGRTIFECLSCNHLLTALADAA
jgi:transcription elongation factor Elf1